MRFYRYQETHYAPMATGWDDEPTGRGSCQVHLLEFELIKETPCGHWIRDDWDDDGRFKRWVSKVSRKRYAYPTKEEALDSFFKRKERQIQILKYQIESAQIALSIGKTIKPNPPEQGKAEVNDCIPNS